MDSPAMLDSASDPRAPDVPRSAMRAARAAASAPATWILAAGIAGAAAWNSHALTLLRVGGPVLGPVVQALAWVLLYGALFVVYAAAERASAESAPRLARRLGIALLLALVSTELVRLAANPVLRPAGWRWQPYVRLFAPLVIAALWCTALLGRETRSVVRALRGREGAWLVAVLATLLVVAAALVTVGDLAFPLAHSGSSVYRRLSVQVIEPRPFITTTLILFVVLALVLAATSSATTAVLLVAPIYATMVFATLVKLHYMHSAVQPLDLLTLPEFMPLFGEFFGGAAIVASIAGIAVWLVALVITWRRMRTPVSRGRRVAIGLASLVLLVLVVGIFLPAERLPGPLSSRGDDLEGLTLKLGAPEGPFREMARSNGIVLTFLSELRTAFVTVPRDYSAERMRVLAGRYLGAGPSRASGAERTGGVSLVLYLVESLMDPNDLGMRFTSEPMPNMRQLGAEQVHGRAIVPREYGGSGNTEFEILTGMTNAFLPAGSIPYRQYVRGPLGALPRVLRDRGYATTSVQADPRYYYDRERVYPLLGFDQSLWLHDEPVRDRAPRGWWPSDNSIVDAVIEASERSRPFFVFAFPSSTHSPYGEGTYAHSSLAAVNAPTRDAAAEVQEYVNAVRTADSAIGRMIEHFRGRRDSVIVAIMGDHLPPLSSSAFALFNQRLARLSAPEQARAARSVPLFVWANFTLPPGELTLSANMLPGYLLERMGVPPDVLFAVTDSVRRTLPVVSAVVQDTAGRLWLRDSVPPALQPSIGDYALVQYDLLLGKRYAKEP
jgi:hypothetical protein